MDKMTDAEMMAHSLLIWANYIETSNVSLSANDVLGMANNAPPSAKINQLNQGQRDMVKRLRDLNKLVLKTSSVMGIDKIDNTKLGYSTGHERNKAKPGGGMFGRR